MAILPPLPLLLAIAAPRPAAPEPAPRPAWVDKSDAHARVLLDVLARLSPESAEAMARQEVERYTFRAPGQATSHFYGYLRWMEIKSRVELALGRGFDRRPYHDFLLAQGLLPPSVLAKAVLSEFAAREKAGTEPAGR
ncbi:MAG TPA: DUF885 family protein [Vicinamibacteria bacterium]|nr:DUF885 family protein [Vicinamibacteria bacterium]